ncbi:MAG: adenylate/guanylate cyclase domain-containing protein [Bacteroidales bacterium]|jgi:class 3 adenylate cyclase/Tfp pilus assembly protein PilF|nr:adenylate/guanylate cyclase domain-containing protein [Bacteroidales bacterium]
MLRSLLLIVILSLLYVQGMAICQQQEYRDSLFRELDMDNIDTNTFLELCDCIKDEIYNDPGQSMQDAKRVLNIALAVNYERALPRLILLQGISYDLMGKYDSALVMYDSALVYAQKLGLKKEEGSIYNNYSIVYSILGQMEQSIDYSMMALKIFESIPDSANMAKVYNGLGSRYSEMGMNEQAIDHYEKAIEINEIFHESRSLVKNYGNIGTVYSELKQHDKALEYYTKAYMIQKDQDNSMDMSITLSNMAITYRNMKKYDLARSFAEQSYLIAKEINDRFGELTYFITLAEINDEEGAYDVALENFLKAEVLADSLGAKLNLLDIYSGLSEIYASKGDYEKAYAYNEKYNTERISLLDNEKNKALDRIKKFEDEKVKTEIDLLTKDAEIQELVIRRQKILRNSIAGLGGFILLLAILLWHRYRYVRRTRNALAEKNIIIQDEKEKSDSLLRNILPEETAEELKEKGSSQARRFEMVSVLFTDFKGFTGMAEVLSPNELVAEIDHCFKAFDNIISNYDIEKIKTIGDAYMCAGGLPVANKTNPEDIVSAALNIRDFMLTLKESREKKGLPYFEIRIGVHTGPVVAGIVGIKKFQYDIWGDTVNIASRMESSGETGEVNISGDTYSLVKDKFECVHRGKIEAKNKGPVDMYFVKGKK